MRWSAYGVVTTPLATLTSGPTSIDALAGTVRASSTKAELGLSPSPVVAAADPGDDRDQELLVGRPGELALAFTKAS